MKLSVIVPAYNEAKTIDQVISKLIRYKEVVEVVVVDDASTDDTVKIINRIREKKLKLVKHAKNQGKGAAIKTGLESVTGDYVLIQDADLEYDPEDIEILTQPIKRKRGTVVYGSRFLGPHSNMFFWHMLGNKWLNLLVNVLYDSIVSDMETGYKLIPTQLLRSLKISENDFRIEPEITCKLLKRKITIIEVPIS